MIFSLGEIVGFIAVSFIVGYIFSHYFMPEKEKKVFCIRSILFAAAITGPAIILHEIAHKFAALSFGLEATFHAAYMWLMIGIVMKALVPGFIFFVPAYVSIQGMSTPLTQTVVSVAGPLVNLALFLIAWAVLALNFFKKKSTLLFCLNNQYRSIAISRGV